MQRLIRNHHELEEIRPLWEYLYSSGNYTIFQSFEWNRLAARIFGERESPVVVAVGCENGAAIIPACANGSGGLSLLGETLFDYRGVLHAGDPAVLEDAWRMLASESGDCKFTAHREGMVVSHPGVELSEFVGAPAAVRSLPYEEQPRLERYLRAMQREGCVFRQSRADRRLLEFIYGEKGKERGNLFADPLRREMAVGMCESTGNRCEVFTLESAGTVVAALITFLDGDWRRCYTTYFDRRWSQFSPGTALLYRVVTETLDEGRDCDLMTGEQPYKTRLANSRVQLYRATVSVEAMRGGKHRTTQAA